RRRRLTTRRGWGGDSCGRRRDITQSGTAFAAESFAGLVGCPTFEAAHEQRGAASGAKFTALAIIAVAFRTAHLSPTLVVAAVSSKRLTVASKPPASRRRMTTCASST